MRDVQGRTADVREVLVDSTLNRGTWIRCKDEMPPENTDVLAYRKGRINIGRWMQRDDGKIWTWAGTTVHEKLATSVPQISCEFSHWMPLPEGPK